MDQLMWLKTENTADMLEHVLEKTSRRKILLFACGIARSRRTSQGVLDERAREIIRTGELLADQSYRQVGDAEPQAAWDKFVRWIRNSETNDADREIAQLFKPYDAVTLAEATKERLARTLINAYHSQDQSYHPMKYRSSREVLRDIFGNPFRPAAIEPAWLAWNNGTVVKLARTIYEDRQWELMPILGDALEDAMCDNSDMLDHCRGPGPHVRGCWVVDLVLGKK